MPYNTNNPVPSSDLRDFSDNQQTLDEVVNSSIKEVTTRTGKKAKTLAGLQADVVAIGQSASQSAQAAASSATAAAQSAADAANSAAATGYVAPPFPDVWAPLNDDLRLLAGFAPADTITVAGTSYPLPSKSLTFARATTATYIDKSGVLQTAAINAPRFEKEGLLIEGQSANYFLNSDDPTKWASKSASLTTAVINDGNTQATTFKGVCNSTAVSNLLTIQSSAISVADGEAFTLSARFKGTYGKFKFRVVKDSGFFGDASFDFSTGIQGGSGNTIGSMTVTSKQGSDGYTYATLTMPNAVAGVYIGQIYIMPADTDTNVPVGTEFYVQTVQFENNSVATSYIPTGASTVTRAADDCTLQRTGNDNYFGPVTIWAEVHCNGPTATDGKTASRRGILSAYPTVGEYFVLMIDSATTVIGKYGFAYASAAFNYSANRIDDGQIHTVCSRSNTRQNQSSIDGTQLTAPTAISRPVPGTVSQANTIFMIGRGAGVQNPGQRMLNGHIRNLRIWHRALSDIQIKGLR